MKRILIIAGIGFVVIVFALGGVGVWWAVEYFQPPPPPSKRLTITDPEVAKLIDHFEGKDEDKRIEAAEALGRMGAKAIDPLRAALKDNSAKVRFSAVQALVFMEAEVLVQAADDLVALLKDDDADVRYKTVFVLGKISAQSGPAYVGIVNALADSNESVRDTAIEVADKLGAPPKEAVPALAKMAGKGADYSTRAKVLPLLAKGGAPAVPVFKDLLKDADTLERIDLVRAVASMDAGAKPLLPELQAFMIANKTRDAEDEVMGALKKCGADGAAVLVQVLKAVNDPKTLDNSRNPALLKAIGEMGAEAKVATPVLTQLLTDGDRWTVEVLDALGGIGPAAKDAAPAVRKLSGTRFDAQAKAALKRMGIMEEKKQQ